MSEDKRLNGEVTELDDRALENVAGGKIKRIPEDDLPADPLAPANGLAEDAPVGALASAPNKPVYPNPNDIIRRKIP